MQANRQNWKPRTLPRKGGAMEPDVDDDDMLMMMTKAMMVVKKV